jgi:ABC-2 type transport system permease protein
MKAQRSKALVRADLAIRRTDIVPVVILVLMPVILIAFLQNAFQPTLVAEGHTSATGAEQAVPGMAVMFAFFLVPNIGYAFYREYGWNTWDRLRSSGASASEIMFGKSIIPLAMALAQATILFTIGVFFFGLRIEGQVILILGVAFAFAVCLIGLALLIVACTRTVVELNAIGNLGALLLAGFAGALTPLSTLPQWAQDFALVTPGYWAMRGYLALVLTRSGTDTALTSMAVLLLYGTVLVLVARVFLRVDRKRTAWT